MDHTALWLCSVDSEPPAGAQGGKMFHDDWKVHFANGGLEIHSSQRDTNVFSHWLNTGTGRKGLRGHTHEVELSVVSETTGTIRMKRG